MKNTVKFSTLPINARFLIKGSKYAKMHDSPRGAGRAANLELGIICVIPQNRNVALAPVES